MPTVEIRLDGGGANESTTHGETKDEAMIAITKYSEFFIFIVRVLRLPWYLAELAIVVNVKIASRPSVRPSIDGFDGAPDSSTWMQPPKGRKTGEDSQYNLKK